MYINRQANEKISFASRFVPTPALFDNHPSDIQNCAIET